MELTKNFYSPATLAKDLAPFASVGLIRSQIKQGALKAYRIGGRNILIKKRDVEEWLSQLPLASEPTNYGSKRGKSRRMKTASELADEVIRRRARKARSNKKR